MGRLAGADKVLPSRLTVARFARLLGWISPANEPLASSGDGDSARDQVGGLGVSRLRVQLDERDQVLPRMFTFSDFPETKRGRGESAKGGRKDVE